MASFKAENIESDDEAEEEIDNTKEIQIEDALKIYQDALKFHSQGASWFKEAGEAYEELFKSDIFRYPESQSEYKRAEILGDQLGSALPYEYVLPAVDGANVENAPSTLPRILHLSYKNRGRYHIDSIVASREKLRDDAPDVGGHDRWVKGFVEPATKALEDFSEALDKDEGDLDLWRRTARISQVLGSARVSRYSLEAALDKDEEGPDALLGYPGVELSFAAHDLRRLEDDIQDELSLQQQLAWKLNLKELPAVWKAQLELYPMFSNAYDFTAAAALGKAHHRDEDSSLQVIEVHEHSWTAVGQALLQRLTAEQDRSVSHAPGSAVKLKLPPPQEPILTEDEAFEQVVSPVSATGPEESKIPLQKSEEPKEQDAPMKEAPVKDQSEPTSPITESPTKCSTMELPTRKRSTEMAELPENAEGGRIRSKRIRARGSILEEAKGADANGTDLGPELNEKIKASSDADQWLFEVIGELARRMGLDAVPDAHDVRALVSPVQKSTAEQRSGQIPLEQAVKTFYQAMQAWTAERSQLLSQVKRPEEDSAGAPNNGLLEFLEYSKARVEDVQTRAEPPGLAQFIERVNEENLTAIEIVLLWLGSLLGTLNHEVTTNGETPSTSYIKNAWVDGLKEIVVRIITNSTVDELLRERFLKVLEILYTDPSNKEEGLDVTGVDRYRAALPQVAENLFELHFDVYSGITNPASTVAVDVRQQQKERLCRWSEIARETMALRRNILEDLPYDALSLRHLWTTVFYLHASGDVAQEHILLCVEDLKKILSKADTPVLHLPNNAVMPEISIAAADREISKLETTDFFLGIFQSDEKLPVDLIESLEPILDRTVLRSASTANGEPSNDLQDAEELDSNESILHSTGLILARFLERTPPSLRLSLWDRLEAAYAKIDYPPKLFSINLRKMEVLVEAMKKPSFSEMKAEERETALLEWLRDLCNLVSACVKIAEEHANAFECIDEDHLKTSTAEVIDLWVLLQSVSLFDDYSQIGQKGGSLVNPFRSYPIEAFHTASIKLHDMQVQTSILLYKMFHEAMKQSPSQFETPQEDRFSFLRHVHYALGTRRLCKASDSLFLRFMKKQLMELPELDQQSSDDLAQILYDMYDLSCFSSPLMKQSHGCDADYLDRTTALELLDFVMDKARKVALKDLIKSDLGKSIEKLHSGLGAVKSSSSFSAARNRVVYLAYIRSAINPLDLYRSLEGLGDVSTSPVPPKEAIVASKGWYLLKGRIALAKANSQRSKGASGSADDIQDAISFLITDLEFSTDNWETWYRLGQAHDALLEEQVLWSAEKINLLPADVAQTQRAAIHCYIMATATLLRNGEPSEELVERMSELCTEFGCRIYSSTRGPFNMRAFSLQDFPEKNMHLQGGPAPSAALKSMDVESAWQFAGALFKKASVAKPDHWVNHYMLAKCLWKLHQQSPAKSKAKNWVPTIIKRLLRAVEATPERKDPSRQDPMLEPTYKTVSIIHKLVLRGDLAESAGEGHIEECLRRQRQFDTSKKPERSECESWSLYVLDILKMLRNADKSRWHHRLVFRAARVMYDKYKEQGTGARLAKEYLIDQHMYSTKTLALTVWKPDQERAGRHWVYMTTYAEFLTKLLEETNDVEAMQILTRRVRKKPNEFFEHAALWDEVVAAFLKLHRRYASVPDNYSDPVFRDLNQDEFAARSARIDAWVNDAKNTHRLKQVLSETAEIRKLNAGLIKATPLEELLADVYAAVWVEVGPSAQELSLAPAPSRHRTPTPSLAPTEAAAAPAPAPAPEAATRHMMSLNNLMNLDGASSPAPTPPPPSLLVQGPDAPALRSRPRLISRREIVKRASDSVMAKPAAKTASPGLKPPTRAADGDARAGADGDADGDGAGAGAAGREGSDAGLEALSSPPASVHDSADDESELSEPDDDGDGEGDGDGDDEDDIIVVRPMFPNLRPNVAAQEVREGRESRDEEMQDVAGEEERGPDTKPEPDAGEKAGEQAVGAVKAERDEDTPMD